MKSCLAGAFAPSTMKEINHATLVYFVEEMETEKFLAHFNLHVIQVEPFLQ